MRVFERFFLSLINHDVPPRLITRKKEGNKKEKKGKKTRKMKARKKKRKKQEIKIRARKRIIKRDEG